MEPDFDGILNELGPETGEREAASAAVLTKEQFFAGFGGMFAMASAMTGLKSLTVEADDDSARQASDAIYDTAAEVPMFRFLIAPGNLYVQRALVVLAFGVPKYQAVKAEALERRGQARARKTVNIIPDAPQGQPRKVSDPLAADFGAGFSPAL
jgi:hypothetical protein